MNLRALQNPLILALAVAYALGLGFGCREKSGERSGTDSRSRNITMFSMSVDDVFSMKTEGVVVAGVVSDGQARPGDQLELRQKQGQVPVTVKGIETFDYAKKEFTPLSQATQGQRVGIWILGIQKSQVNKGDILASKQ
jgi:selenocysteine-specific translation elongation factor